MNNSTALEFRNITDGWPTFEIRRLASAAGVKPMQKMLRHIHSHTGLEIAGILKGRPIQFFNGKQYPLQPGDIVLIEPMYHHEISGQNSDCIVVHVSRQLVADAHINKKNLFMLNAFFALQSGMSPVIRGESRQVQILCDAYKLFATGSIENIQTAFFKVMQVCSKIAESVNNRMTSTSDIRLNKNHALVPPILNYLHEHYAQNFGLEELADTFHISNSLLSHSFKEYVGVSPIEFRTRIRVNQAAELIQTTDLKLLTIAGQCGFKNMATFYRIFKKQLGITPASLR